MMCNQDYRQKCLAQKINVCNACGSSDELVVHHIDGDRENNRLDNLVPLCPDCHNKIHSQKNVSAKLKRLREKLPRSSLRFGVNTDGVVDTSIPIDSDVRDDLRAEKHGNETYSDVISRLLESHNE